TLPGNTVTNPKEDLKGITTRSGVAYQGPPIPTSSVVKPIPEVTKDQVHPSCSPSTAPVQPPVGPEPIVEPIVAPVPSTKPSVSLPYPSRRDNEKSRNQANEQIDKFYEIFKEMSFEISFTDALGWHGMLSISRFGDSINLNAIFSLGKRLSLPDLTPTCMDARTCGIDQFLTMELQRHLVKIGTSRALIDVHKGEIKTPLIGSEAITYNLESLLRDNPANYTHMRQTKLTSLIGLWDILSRDCLPFEYAIFGGGLGQQVARHYLLKELDVEEKIRLCKGAKVPQASSRLRSNINEEVPGIAWYLEYPKKGRNTVVVNENMSWIQLVWSYLIMNKSIVHTDHSALKYLFAKKDAKARLLRWVLLLQEFDFKVIDTKGAEPRSDHLASDLWARSRLSRGNKYILRGSSRLFVQNGLKQKAVRACLHPP
ncbi:reverse transcriptase domain-containing protein, partial [Tanacetum coccineum]